MLNKIRDKLKEIDENVFYGVAKEIDQTGEPIWNYIVFGRKQMTPKENQTSFTEEYEIVIVRENYIPEKLIDEVIAKVEECGVRFSNQPAEYKYARKNNTDAVVELLVMRFIKSRKRSY